MSFSFGFYNALNHDRLYDAIQVSEIFDGLIRDGVYSTIGDHYVVKASENENEVIVGSGRAWFDHTWNKNDADLPITAPLPDLLMKRYDALVIDINANVASRTNQITWVEGTPSLNTPVKPTLTNTTDHHQYPLCYILRTANNNTIIQDDIENTIGTDECPFVTGILQQVSISDLLLQWTSQFATFMNNNEATASAWEAEWEASMSQWTVEQKNEFATWMAGEKTEFDDWFANLHYILDGDVAGHLQNEIDAIEEGLGGSVFTIHTINSSLYGKTVTCTGSTQEKTAVFDASGNAEIKGITDVGTITFTATDGSQTATTQISVPYFSNYPITMAFWAATVNLSTTSEDLKGKTITIRKGGAVVGSTSFNAAGAATYTATSAGTYTFTCQGYSTEVAITEETTYNVSINSYNITITADASVLEGETLTATNGTDTKTATITNGEAKFRLAAGNWEVAGIPITVVDGQTYTKQIVVFAYHYSENDSNPDSGNYPSGYDNYGWTPFTMDLSTGIPNYGSWNPSGANADKLAWFYPKSCMLKYDGMVDYYLSETDETKKEDGTTASDVANSSYGGNAMMEWGQDGYRHYWKLVPDQDSKGWTFVTSNAEVLNCKPWNHYDANDNVNRHWYTAKYFGSNVSSKLRSISGGSNFVNNTRNTEVTYARANNTDANIIWDTEVFCDYQYIGLLCCLLAKNNNSQAKFGAGRSASGNSSAIGQGTMNGTGLFYGKFNGTEGVKIFGMENFYGNLWRSIRGLISLSGAIRVKMTHGTADGSTVSDYNFDGTGYIAACNYGGNNPHGYINHMHVTDKFMAPNGVSGSETTYYTDYTWLYTSGTYYAFVGGPWRSTGIDGVFCYYLGDTVSHTGASYGATISCKPLAS